MKKRQFSAFIYTLQAFERIAPNGQLLTGVKLSRYSFFLCFSGQRRLSWLTWETAHCFRATWILNRTGQCHGVNTNDIEGVQLLFVAQLFLAEWGTLYPSITMGNEPRSWYGNTPVWIRLIGGKEIRCGNLNDKLNSAYDFTTCPFWE